MNADATHPVMEIFGPTVQGEGPDAGRPTYFVRFGGCDYRCAWCDSMHAVDPARVRAGATKMPVGEILARIEALDRGPSMVILSGGNPALHQLGWLVTLLQQRGMDVAVETQGSMWRDWLADVDRLVVSPKPPSSGMAAKTAEQLPAFMAKATTLLGNPGALALKVVIDDDEDLRWAREIAKVYEDVPLYLSVCTPYLDSGKPVHADDRITQADITERLGLLYEAVARDPLLSTARVLPQLHVLAWGTRQGV